MKLATILSQLLLFRYTKSTLSNTPGQSKSPRHEHGQATTVESNYSSSQAAAQCQRIAAITPSPPLQNFIRWPIPDSPIILEFFAFGPLIPALELVAELSAAVNAVSLKVLRGHRDQHIPAGLFVHVLRWSSGSTMSTTICDFAQMGRALSWGKLVYALKGVLDWLEWVWKVYQQLSFNIVLAGEGLMGFGRFEWKEGGGLEREREEKERGGGVGDDTATTRLDRRWIAATGNETRVDAGAARKARHICDKKRQYPLAGANLVPYHRDGFRTSLELYNFGGEMPRDELSDALLRAVDMVIEKGRQGKLMDHIPAGLFIFIVRYDSGDNITMSMCDFHMLGKPMIWQDVGETLRGLYYYMRWESKVFQEVNFNVLGPEGELLGCGATIWERSQEPVATVVE